MFKPKPLKFHLRLFVVFSLLALSISAAAQDDKNIFGNKEWMGNGLKGNIYFLPENTQRLPLFDTMKVMGTVYAQTINIPARDWTSGFPDIPDRHEWFGIEYTGRFKPNQPGLYQFRIHSDDGAKLFIDDSLVVDNDGIHGPSSATGQYFLEDKKYDIRLQYFQGPRQQIALQLFASLKDSTEQAFPGNSFTFYAPGSSVNYVVWTVVLLLIFMLLLFFIFRRKKKPAKVITG